ncbi:hypothetical protein QDR37_03410 [Amnibacterium sp. CER49]|uniref:hypothetical protein n=1 Tax=Amnibacterium sp. CER49 TaxID=3039161 RepID=UPI00244ADE4F|nr:hypothetical protein [Amnibacterium sp. CER49]MDH2442987.1 hypothetical protein [Amnibacterium sp. CER49]
MPWLGIVITATAVWIAVSIVAAMLFAQSVAVANKRRPRPRRPTSSAAARLGRFVSVATGSIPVIGPKLVSLATGAIPVIRHTD